MLSNDFIIQPFHIGVATRHGLGFRFDVPDGAPDALLMCFRVPTVILVNGELLTAGAGDCIIQSPGEPLLHYAANEPGQLFCNDWCYLDPGFAAAVLAGTELKFDTLYPTGDANFAETTLSEVINELTHPDVYSPRATELKMELFFLQLKRQALHIACCEERLTAVEREYFSAFVRLRRELAAGCAQKICVGDLAKQVNLSKERFGVLYQKFFGVTAYMDVIDHRIALAGRLLKSGMPIKNVAAACGWEDVAYFSRIFRKKSGMTPGVARGFESPALPDSKKVSRERAKPFSHKL